MSVAVPASLKLPGSCVCWCNTLNMRLKMNIYGNYLDKTKNVLNIWINYKSSKGCKPLNKKIRGIYKMVNETTTFKSVRTGTNSDITHSTAGSWSWDISNVVYQLPLLTRSKRFHWTNFNLIEGQNNWPPLRVSTQIKTIINLYTNMLLHVTVTTSKFWTCPPIDFKT